MGEVLAIAYYCTGHGLGHATRVVEVCRHLCEAGHYVTIVTAAPADVFTSALPPGTFALRRVVLDTGAKQLDAFSVDQSGSLEDYQAAAVECRPEILAEEVAWLQAAGKDLVVSDVVPLACAAASAAGVPSVCVSNFSWDFIYSEYVTAAGAQFRDLIWQIADDYACAQLLLRLPGYVPMPAFREVIDVPLVVRKAQRSRKEVRLELGVGEDVPLALFMYGGQPAGAHWKLDEGCLPPGWKCVLLKPLVEGQPLPPNFILAKPEAFSPDMIEACDVVVGKIGYGSVSECLAHRRPLVFLRRDFFNEEPFLRRLLEVHDAAVEMKRRDFLSGNWAPYLEAAKQLRPYYDDPVDGAAVVASLLCQVVSDVRQGCTVLTPFPQGSQGQLSVVARGGTSRLRDTIAWGYILGRHAEREPQVDLLDWYINGQPPADPPTSARLLTSNGTPSGGTRTPSPTDLPSSEGGDRPSQRTLTIDGGFTVVEGPPQLHQHKDTLRFVALLANLDDPPPAEGREAAERRAARGLFCWEDEVIIGRAPGRLDVMGGIADYSGSLVLQMPVAEAAHAAVQRQPPGKQRLWRHMASRQGSRSSSPTPPGAALRIVSLGADSINRGPAFDMDLCELFTPDGSQPISYEEARAYFRRDPALSWAAYVAGALVVLMREKGLRPSDGISVLVSSAVPPGKGVSSSAALEVATMVALAAAYGVALEGRELALLCQKVENLVVGAPCGVMDQMASSLGKAGSLLALRCQPAEVEGAVHVPPHLRFWGIDSGIRHSVGGSDYGAVRVGAFMGLRIASQLAHEDASTSGEVLPLGGGFLTKVPPSQFSARYERRLPEALSGAAFLQQYGSHWDAATEVEPDKTYAVRQAAAHPVQENFRVQAFRQVLAVRGSDPRQQLEVLGELMLQSHASYGACGLGSQGTDRLVELVLQEKAAAEAAGQEPALFGAKITGGGCGGTVCVLGSADARGEAALQRVTERYAKETSHSPQVFSGTSSGAVDFGVVRLLRNSGKSME